MLYVHHRLVCQSLTWSSVARRIASDVRPDLEALGAHLYGIWRPQIGRPRDELSMLTVVPDAAVGARVIARVATVPGLAAQSFDLMAPTVRPLSPERPTRQGNYAFRWFETPSRHWDEFLALCQGAWPDFEASYDSQIIGLWRVSPDTGGAIKTLLMTRRPDLAMWERSKLPANEVEAEVRRKLSRRYDLCTDTVVYTTTLLTADDRADTARWA